MTATIDRSLLDRAATDEDDVAVILVTHVRLWGSVVVVVGSDYVGRPVAAIPDGRTARRISDELVRSRSVVATVPTWCVLPLVPTEAIA